MTQPKLCQVCYLQGTKYTCPSCDMKYCSLSCFKSDSHSDCLEEGFYKRAVEEMLRSTNVCDKQRKEMVDMLKRIKEEDEQFDIASLSLGTIDDAIHDDEAAMDPKNKEQFDKLVDSGNFGILIDLWVPWWSLASSAPVPSLAPVPKITIKPHQDLYYILIEFIFSYVVAIRTMNGDTDDTLELVNVILSLSQIMSQTRTNFTYSSANEVIETIRYRFLLSEMKFNPKSLPLFLKDVVDILSRKEWVMVVLSELMRFMKCKKLVYRKLQYFLGIVNEIDKAILELLITGIKQQSLLLSRDPDVGEMARSVVEDFCKKPLIEEI